MEFVNSLFGHNISNQRNTFFLMKENHIQKLTFNHHAKHKNNKVD